MNQVAPERLLCEQELLVEMQCCLEIVVRHVRSVQAHSVHAGGLRAVATVLDDKWLLRTVLAAARRVGVRTDQQIAELASRLTTVSLGAGWVQIYAKLRTTA